MRRGIRCFVAIPGMAAASVLSGATEASLPPLSAAGLSKPPPPPEIFDASGRKLPARLIQVQTVFRHGARLPVEDRGCRDGLATWSPSETDKSAQLQRCGRIRLFEFGSGDALDPAELFSNDSEGKLVGGGIGGRLTPLGLRQASCPSWPEMARDGPSWPEMARDGPSWPEMARDGPRWLEMARAGPRWPEMARDGLRWLEMA